MPVDHRARLEKPRAPAGFPRWFEELRRTRRGLEGSEWLHGGRLLLDCWVATDAQLEAEAGVRKREEELRLQED